MKKENKEILTLIARRQPPGDRWILEGESITYNGIADTLKAWFENNEIKADFRLEPLKGKLYAITTIEVPVEVATPKTYSIYGDYEV